MNNKLMSYEDALEELKRLEILQRINKRARKSSYKDIRSISQENVSSYKKKINAYLTIIHLHKQNRKLWGKLNEKS